MTNLNDTPSRGRLTAKDINKREPDVMKKPASREALDTEAVIGWFGLWVVGVLLMLAAWHAAASLWDVIAGLLS